MSWSRTLRQSNPKSFTWDLEFLVDSGTTRENYSSQDTSCTKDTSKKKRTKHESASKKKRLC